jgi:hypothetical protein
MSETITAEESADVGIPSTRDTMAAMQWKDAAVTDVAAFDSGIDTVVSLIPEIVASENVTTALMVKLARAIIAIRIACTFNGTYDWFGVGGAYKDAYERKITRRVLEANPNIPESRITSILTQVRNNYLGESATRAKGMLADAIALQAVKDGKVPGAKVQGEKIVIRPTVKDKNSGEQVPKMTPELGKDGAAVKDKDGKVKQVPVVLEFIPGIGNATVPDALKPAVREAIKKQGRAGQKVPARYGGPAKGKGGNTPSEPPVASDLYRKGLDLITSNLNLNPLLAVGTFHAAATALVDSINVPETVKHEEIASVLEDIAHLLTIEAAILRPGDDAKLEDLDPFRFQEPVKDAS